MRYFLIGLPGSGKSYWGKVWSEKMKIPYFDLDQLIEKKEGLSIKEIFEIKGEAYFREVESFCLRNLIDTYDSFILATGGGTPCLQENMQLMNDKGSTVFLNLPLAEISKRIWNPDDANRRPLLKGCNSIADIEARLQQLNENRLPFYLMAKMELKKWDESTLSNHK